MPNKIDPELQKQIEEVRAEVRRQEESGQFNTAHHEVLQNLLRKAGDKPTTKAVEETKE